MDQDRPIEHGRDSIRTGDFFELNGELKTLAEWCEVFGLDTRTFMSRVRSDWPLEEALTAPKGHRLGSNKALLPDVDWPWERSDWSWYVVECHPGGLTLDEIGQLVGLTRERVRQIQQKAIEKLLAVPSRRRVLEQLLDDSRYLQQHSTTMWDHTVPKGSKNSNTPKGKRGRAAVRPRKVRRRMGREDRKPPAGSSVSAKPGHWWCNEHELDYPIDLGCVSCSVNSDMDRKEAAANQGKDIGDKLNDLFEPGTTNLTGPAPESTPPPEPDPDPEPAPESPPAPPARQSNGKARRTCKWKLPDGSICGSPDHDSRFHKKKRKKAKTKPKPPAPRPPAPPPADEGPTALAIRARELEVHDVTPRLTNNTFQLRRGVFVEVELPVDLTPADVDRMYSWLNALAFDEGEHG